MLNTKKSTVLIKALISIVAICAVLFCLCPATFTAYAADNIYTDVLDDLQNDPNFNIDDYPVNQTDFSLQLIQLVESKSNELLAYVYQPSAGKFDVLASKIRISFDELKTFEDVQHYQDFNLTLLSRNGQFFKYKIDSYVTDVSFSFRREYNVVQLMRKADKRCGDELVDSNNNTISQISYLVGRKITIETREDEIYYGSEKLDVVEIKYKYCGQLKFENGFTSVFPAFGTKSGMLHFVAFNGQGVLSNGEKIPIEALYEADVRYTITTYKHETTEYLWGLIIDENDSKETNVRNRTLSSDVEEIYKDGIFSKEHKWHQIMTKDDFINVVRQSSAFYKSDFTPAAESEINDAEYVLMLEMTEFMDTSYSTDVYGSMWHGYYTESALNDVSILRLYFSSNDKVYNLGVVDNYQSGDGVPDNYEGYGINEEWWKGLFSEVLDWLKLIAIVIGIVLLIALIAVFFNPIMKFLKFIGKFIFVIISAPFKFIFWLFGGSSRKRSSSVKRKKG